LIVAALISLLGHDERNALFALAAPRTSLLANHTRTATVRKSAAIADILDSLEE
jgi:hypothetical protein